MKWICPKCNLALKEGPACISGFSSWPLLACWPCNSVFNHPEHPISGIPVIVLRYGEE